MALVFLQARLQILAWCLCFGTTISEARALLPAVRSTAASDQQCAGVAPGLFQLRCPDAGTELRAIAANGSQFRPQGGTEGGKPSRGHRIQKKPVDQLLGGLEGGVAERIPEAREERRTAGGRSGQGPACSGHGKGRVEEHSPGRLEWPARPTCTPRRRCSCHVGCDGSELAAGRKCGCPGGYLAACPLGGVLGPDFPCLWTSSWLSVRFAGESSSGCWGDSRQLPPGAKSSCHALSAVDATSSCTARLSGCQYGRTRSLQRGGHPRSLPDVSELTLSEDKSRNFAECQSQPIHRAEGRSSTATCRDPSARTGQFANAGVVFDDNKSYDTLRRQGWVHPQHRPPGEAHTGFHSGRRGRAHFQAWPGRPRRCELVYRKMPGREGEYGPEAKLVGPCLRSEACLGCKPRSPYLPVDFSDRAFTFPACPKHLRRSQVVGSDVQPFVDFRLPWALAEPVGKFCPTLALSWNFGACDSRGGHTEWSIHFFLAHVCSSCDPNTVLQAEKAPKTRIGGSGTCAFSLCFQDRNPRMWSFLCISPLRCVPRLCSGSLFSEPAPSSRDALPTPRCLNDTSVALGYLPMGSEGTSKPDTTGRWPCRKQFLQPLLHLVAWILSTATASIVPFFCSLQVLVGCMLWKMLLWRCPGRPLSVVRPLDLGLAGVPFGPAKAMAAASPRAPVLTWTAVNNPAKRRKPRPRSFVLHGCCKLVV